MFNLVFFMVFHSAKEEKNYVSICSQFYLPNSVESRIVVRRNHYFSVSFETNLFNFFKRSRPNG
jgi:hypothetical protein